MAEQFDAWPVGRWFQTQKTENQGFFEKKGAETKLAELAEKAAKAAKTEERREAYAEAYAEERARIAEKAAEKAAKKAEERREAYAKEHARREAIAEKAGEAEEDAEDTMPGLGAPALAEETDTMPGLGTRLELFINGAAEQVIETGRAAQPTAEYIMILNVLSALRQTDPHVFADRLEFV